MPDNDENNENDSLEDCPFSTASNVSAAFENIPAEETAEIEEIARLTTELQDKRINLPKQEGAVMRGVHPKAHGCVAASFVINEDIEAQYQLGLFACPGAVYNAHIRFSNATAEITADSTLVPADQANPTKWEHESRGMAIKVYDVEGDVIDEDRDCQKNQDFLMINLPQFAFQDVHSYLFLTRELLRSEFGNNADALFALGKITLGIMKARGATNMIPTAVDFDALKGFLASPKNLGKFEIPEGFILSDLQKVVASTIIVGGKIQKQAVRNPLQVQYFSASPFLFGDDRVMKFSASPHTPIPQSEFGTSPPEEVNDDFLREAMGKTLQEESTIIYDFKILVRDGDFGDDQILIEDSTTTWKKDDIEEIDQYVSVAQLIIDTDQDISSPEAIKQCKDLVFTPWHSLKEHKPIGGINRLRRSVYKNSAKHRQ